MIRQRQVLAALAGASAFALALAITEPLGPGLDPDGRSYLFAASTLAHRGTMLDIRDHWLAADSMRVFTRWPPAFPIAIAAPVFVGVHPVQGARLVMALSAALTFALLAWLVSGVVGPRAAMASLALVAVAPPIVIVHESVLSEPMFFAAIATGNAGGQRVNTFTLSASGHSSRMSSIAPRCASVDAANRYDLPSGSSPGPSGSVIANASANADAPARAASSCR